MSLWTSVQRWAIREEMRLADLLPPRLSIRARYPLLPTGPFTLAQIIEVENTPYDNPARGAHVERIGPDTVKAVAALIEQVATQTGLPIWYLAACLCRESRFDPEAYNHNLTAFRRTPTFDSTDWGIAQFSGKYNKIAGATESQMEALFFSAGWEIPRFAAKMAGLVAWARGVLASPQAARISDAAAKSASRSVYATPENLPYWLATYGYNSGTGVGPVDTTRGALGDLLGVEARISHPNAVMSTAVEFAQEMTPRMPVSISPIELVKAHAAGPRKGGDGMGTEFVGTRGQARGLRPNPDGTISFEIDGATFTGAGIQQVPDDTEGYIVGISCSRQTPPQPHDGLKAAGPTGAAFPDVVGHKYAAEIETLHGLGIVVGRDDGLYHPDDPMTRGEFAEAVARIAGLKGPIPASTVPGGGINIIAVLMQLMILYTQYQVLPPGGEIKSPGVPFTDTGKTFIAGAYISRLT